MLRTKNYERSLFEKRVEVYPKLYSLCSRFEKLYSYGKHSTEELIELRNKIDEWNNLHSMFFSRATSKISYRFRRYLNLLLNDGTNSILKESDWEFINDILDTFEMSLRADVGIFDTKPAGELLWVQDMCDKLDKKMMTLQKRDTLPPSQYEKG